MGFEKKSCSLLFFLAKRRIAIPFGRHYLIHLCQNKHFLKKPMDPNTAPHTALDGTQVGWLEIVRQKVENLRYGSVQITVHEGRVVLVENIEKISFMADAKKGPAKNAKS